MEYHALITYIVEIIAAFSGFYFYKKNRGSKIRYFFYFLVFTLCVESIATYTSLYDKLDFLRPLQQTKFQHNFWLYNSFVIVSMFFYLFFYEKVLRTNFNKKIIRVLSVISIFVVLYNLYKFSGDYFTTNLKYNFLWVTVCVFVCVALYFHELLMSDKILSFYRSTLFYISIGLLVWWLVFPPVALYLPYYKTAYPNMIYLRGFMLIVANVFLYGCYTIGFLWGKDK